jgi:S-methylmethionine-dependent homocysteine/selenocysteine methylase
VLPQLSGDRLFLTDGGLETTLIFHGGIDLPYFAAFTLLEDEAGAEALRRYFEPYLAIAREQGAGIVLDSATWRASRDWAERLGYSPEQLAEANRRAVALVAGLREPDVPVVLNGVVGPRGDGYVVGDAMTAAEAEAYHAEQIGTFAGTAAEMVSAITMTYVDEAVGITRAAQAAGLPAAISFTVETDGRLPSGQPLREAIEQVDAETGSGPAYFMVNCAHPTHFAGVLEDGPWLERIGGLRANASTMSHAELDEAAELDEGDPAQLAADYRALRDRLPNANVLGGCCGTDHRHVGAIAAAWLSEPGVEPT